MQKKRNETRVTATTTFSMTSIARSCNHAVCIRTPSKATHDVRCDVYACVCGFTHSELHSFCGMTQMQNKTLYLAFGSICRISTSFRITLMRNGMNWVCAKGMVNIWGIGRMCVCAPPLPFPSLYRCLFLIIVIIIQSIFQLILYVDLKCQANRVNTFSTERRNRRNS